MGKDEQLNVIIIGDYGVGKSCILKRYAEGKYTAGDCKIKGDYKQCKVRIGTKNKILRIVSEWICFLQSGEGYIFSNMVV